jgi:hypothetical protein
MEAAGKFEASSAKSGGRRNEPIVKCTTTASVLSPGLHLVGWENISQAEAIGIGLRWRVRSVKMLRPYAQGKNKI